MSCGVQAVSLTLVPCSKCSDNTGSGPSFQPNNCTAISLEQNVLVRSFGSLRHNKSGLEQPYLYKCVWQPLCLAAFVPVDTHFCTIARFVYNRGQEYVQGGCDEYVWTGTQ